MTKILVLVMREKAISGMMAAGKGGTIVEDTIRQKSVSDIAVQTTNEEGLVPLPVSDVAIDVDCLLTSTPPGWLGGTYSVQQMCILC